MNPASSERNRPAPTLRRAYFDCRYGQLHVHQAIPAGGGFDEATAVICVPAEPGVASVFLPWLPQLGIDRSVYAIDLPGCGMSDGARTASAAAAISDFMANMHLRQANLLVQVGALTIVRQLVGAEGERIPRVAIWDDKTLLTDLSTRLTIPQLLLESAAAIDTAIVRLRVFFGTPK
jgi:pimeloyl-ACP methyl ester carboxylesterase